MDRKETLSRIKALTTILNEYRAAYYNDSISYVSDAEYDKMLDELAELEKKADFHFANSPNYNVGYTVNDDLPKVKLEIPLLSLDKTKDVVVAKDFTKKRKGILMHKLDGLTICLTYENGELVSASTRGNGEVGQLITDNARTFTNLPVRIPYKDRLMLTGEAIIHISDFNKINSKIENDEDKYKEPRNLASGSVQQHDSSICAERNVHFYCFEILIGLDDIGNMDEKFEAIKDIGFETVDYICFDENTSEEEFKKHVDELFLLAGDKQIPIDGLVVKYNDIEYGKSLGRTAKWYRNGIALKFKEDEVESTVLNIDWSVSRTGKITPVAVFEPVEINGSTVERASLHNLNTMEDLGIKPHCTATVIKANEIIPQIISCVGGDSYEFEVPRKCPVCGGETRVVINGSTKTLFCFNEKCAAKNISSLTHFCSRSAMNIDGLSEKLLERMVNLKIVNNFADIYEIKNHTDFLSKLDGLGEKSCAKLVKAIDDSRNVKLENFIVAIGIPSIGLEKAKIISKQFSGSWENFENAVLSNFDFAKLKSFGYEINKNIYDYFNNVYSKDIKLQKLISLMNFIVEEESTNKKIFDGMTFAITGTTKIYSNRKEIQNIIESFGGKVSGSVSSKTNYLINNDVNSTSGKNKAARENNVPIISEGQFKEMLEKA